MFRYFGKNHGLGVSFVGLLSLRNASRIFCRELTAAARKRGAIGWLEKTPRHFCAVDRIRECIPECSFVHVVREGLAACASMRDRANRFPGQFGKESGIKFMSSIWNQAIQSAAEQYGARDTIVIPYETFVADPVAVMNRVSRKLNLPDSRGTSPARPAIGEMFSAYQEPWKASAAGVVHPANSKASRVFSQHEILELQSRLNLRLYEKLLKETQIVENVRPLTPRSR